MLNDYHSFQPTLTQSGLNKLGIKCKQIFASKALSNVIYAFIEIQIESPTIYPVIPDGMINLFISDSSLFIAGVQTKTNTLPLMQAGKYFGIRFYPGGLNRLFNVNMQEICDQQVSNLFIPDSAFIDILSMCFEARNFKQSVGLCESWFISRLNNKTNIKFEWVLNEIIKTNGDLKINTIAQTIQLSPRQINRQFMQNIGVNTKTFTQIIKLQNSVKTLFKYRNQLESTHGYFDQSHQIHAFKRFLSCPPSALLKQFS
ncbi:MAG: hypothetical protein HRU38_15405 [Saccharospirillaceae bacterium]|nr:helix-turn-helix domain-containing protein [Pseudomonadales bacterium]NRB80027.1 hypothetical protein [Saccharospirillaceae bacterium]